MSITSIISTRVDRRNICQTFSSAGTWFYEPLLSGNKVTLYASCPNHSKSIILHIRRKSNVAIVPSSAQLKCDKLSIIDCGLPLGQSFSKRNKCYVIRYRVTVPIDELFKMLSDSSCVFETDNFTEQLTSCRKSIDIALFLAYCLGYDNLPEDYKKVLNDEVGWENRLEEKKAKEEEEKERNRLIQKQKRLEAEKNRKETPVDPQALEAKKRACLRESSIIFLNYLINSLLDANNKDFFDCGRSKYYYEFHITCIEKAHEFISKDKTLKKKYPGITISQKAMLSTLEKKEIMYSYQDDGMPYPRYCILKLNNRQVEEMIDEHKNKEEILKELSGAVTGEHKGSKGCYVATDVYGSYDCPEVWTLRRFRDNSLAQSWFGRLFIKTYYAVSPILVKWFGQSAWFKTLWRKPLDYLVDKLHYEGFDDTPYQDKY